MKKGSRIREGSLGRLYSIVVGDESRILHVTSGGEDLISAPLMLAAALLIVFDIPSWVIGCLLLILVLFDMDINTAVRKKKDRLERSTVKREEYRSRIPERSIVTDRDGYSEIIIR